MLNFLNNFFRGNSGNRGDSSVLGVDIGASSIKVVQLKKKGGQAVLQTYGEISLGPYSGVEVGRATKIDTAKMTEALGDLLKESNTSTVNGALSIPMRYSMVSTFDMPNISNDQLAKMVPIEARKYIPVPIAEVALDWFVIPEVSNNPDEEKAKKTVETMVVAIHNDILNDYSTIVSNSKLNISFFEVEMFSTARAVLQSGYLTPVMIVDIGAGATKVYITERGVVRDSHIISRGSQDITSSISTSMGVDITFAEQMKRNYGKNETEKDVKISGVIDAILNPIFSDANSVMLKFQKKHNKNVTKVILVGGGSLLTGISDKAQKFFGIEASIGKPFDKIQTPAFLEPILRDTGVMFAGAIGLAMRKLQELE